MHVLDKIQMEVAELREHVAELKVEAAEARSTSRFASAIAVVALVLAALLAWTQYS